jgi:hypothetical protein
MAALQNAIPSPAKTDAGLKKCPGETRRMTMQMSFNFDTEPADLRKPIDPEPEDLRKPIDPEPTDLRKLIDAEPTDLRKPPIDEARGILLAYGCPLPPPRQTRGLELGTQQRFCTAAYAAHRQGYPLNTLLTVRWDSLFSDNDVHDLRTMTIPGRIDNIMERFRKWLTHRELPPLYIWVRESVLQVGEHWHLGLHLPQKWRPRFIEFVESVFVEPRLPHLRPATKRSDGEFACGEIGSWQLANDTRPERGGRYLAAYLGKAEPSQRVFRGKLRNNTQKPVRGIQFGGKEPNGKYDADQGVIIGTATREDRFYISKALQAMVRPQKARAGKGKDNVVPSVRQTVSEGSQLKGQDPAKAARQTRPHAGRRGKGARDPATSRASVTSPQHAPSACKTLDLTSHHERATP